MQTNITVNQNNTRLKSQLYPKRKFGRYSKIRRLFARTIERMRKACLFSAASWAAANPENECEKAPGGGGGAEGVPRKRTRGNGHEARRKKAWLDKVNQRNITAQEAKSKPEEPKKTSGVVPVNISNSRKGAMLRFSNGKPVFRGKLSKARRKERRLAIKEGRLAVVSAQALTQRDWMICGATSRNSPEPCRCPSRQFRRLNLERGEIEEWRGACSHHLPRLPPGVLTKVGGPGCLPREVREPTRRMTRAFVLRS